MYKSITNTLNQEQWHISIVLFQNFIKNFEFDYVLNIWLDDITFDIFTYSGEGAWLWCEFYFEL